MIAGGSSIFAPAFDPRVFWDVVGPMGATWYYAAPTMHHRILQEHEQDMLATPQQEPPRTRIRYVPARGSRPHEVSYAPLSVALPSKRRLVSMLTPLSLLCFCRFIANAAGPLPPSLAVSLRTCFQQAAVLPSYGMTEW